MAFPANLHFRDRRAEGDDGTCYVDCSRHGHPPGQRRIKRAFHTRRDRELYITRHDAKYHDELLAQQLGIRRAPSLGEVVGDFLRHIGRLASDGKRDPKTVRYYRGICDKLIHYFGSETALDTIGRRAGLRYVELRRKDGSTSQGARFLKELKVVRRLQVFAEIPVFWKLPIDDISPVHRLRASIPIEDIRDFLAAMPEGSMERAFAFTKFITMLRNEELYAANVGDVNLKDQTLSYWLRNKQAGDKERHVSHLPGVLLPLLLPLVENRKGAEPLFYLTDTDRDGRRYSRRKLRRLTDSSLRVRLLAASKRATETRKAALSSSQCVGPSVCDDASPHRAVPVRITAIGQFRHEAATIAMSALGTKAVADHLDHKDEKTTRGKYKLRKQAEALAQSKKVTEAAESKLVN